MFQQIYPYWHDFNIYNFETFKFTWIYLFSIAFLDQHRQIKGKSSTIWFECFHSLQKGKILGQTLCSKSEYLNFLKIPTIQYTCYFPYMYSARSIKFQIIDFIHTKMINNNIHHWLRMYSYFSIYFDCPKGTSFQIR